MSPTTTTIPPCGGARAEMPKYKCHKEVSALKIKEITFDADIAKEENRETTGCAVIMPAEDGYASFEVDAEYVRKHKPEAGGYFVRYKDGYVSFSPAKAFEEGYKSAKHTFAKAAALWPIRIAYQGELNTELDERIAVVMRKIGYAFNGSGYNMETNTRDISFEMIG